MSGLFDDSELTPTERVAFGFSTKKTPEKGSVDILELIKNISKERGNVEVNHYRDKVGMNFDKQDPSTQKAMLRFFIIGAWTCPADQDKLDMVLDENIEKSKGARVNGAIFDLRNKAPMVKTKAIFELGSKLLPIIFEGVPKQFRSWGIFVTGMGDRLDPVSSHMFETWFYSRNGQLKYLRSLWALLDAEKARQVLLAQTLIAVRALDWYFDQYKRGDFPDNVDDPYIYKEHPFEQFNWKDKVDIVDEEEAANMIRMGRTADTLTIGECLSLATVVRPSLFLNHRGIKQAGKRIPLKDLEFCMTCYNLIAASVKKFNSGYKPKVMEITKKADFNESYRSVTNNAHYILAKGRMMIKGATGQLSGNEAREISAFKIDPSKTDIISVMRRISK